MPRGSFQTIKLLKPSNSLYFYQEAGIAMTVGVSALSATIRDIQKLNPKPHAPHSNNQKPETSNQQPAPQQPATSNQQPATSNQINQQRQTATPVS